MSAAAATLLVLRDRLVERGIKVTGSHTGQPSSDWDYLELSSGRHVHVQLDSAGYWQALIYEGPHIVRMADVDGGDWPGDPV